MLSCQAVLVKEKGDIPVSMRLVLVRADGESRPDECKAYSDAVKTAEAWRATLMVKSLITGAVDLKSLSVKYRYSL